MRPTRPQPYSTYEYHGMSRTPEYRVWVGMKARCYHPKTKGYVRYGARGIRVCERWHSFSNFISDMGRRPASGYDIARLDADGHYEPGNCQWQLHSRNMQHLRPRKCHHA